MEKFVKLDAIERLAKPMAEFHKGEKPAMEEELCECPKCGHTFKVVKAEPEYEEEYEEYEDD